MQGDDPAVLDHGVFIERWFHVSHGRCLIEVASDALACLLVHEERIGPVMGGPCAVSLEQFYSERWNVALLTAVGGVPCHHIAISLRARCYMRAIAGTDAFT